MVVSKLGYKLEKINSKKIKIFQKTVDIYEIKW